MKKIITFMICLFILTTISIPTISHAKWKDQENVQFIGQMARVDVELSSYSIDLSEDPLEPGWIDTVTFDVTNLGTIAVTLTGILSDVPSFLTVVLDIPGGVVLPGEVVIVTLNLSIPEDIDQSYEEADSGFSLRITGIQL